jgi:hypothetical protein
MAAASGLDGTLISEKARADGDGGICIVGPAAGVRARATVNGSDRLARVGGPNCAVSHARDRAGVIRGQLALSVS